MCKRDGFRVNVTLAKRRRILRDNERNGLPTYLPIPELVPWEIFHSRCNGSTNPRIEATADEYRIDAKQIRSMKDLIELTADLIKKDWVIDTSWSGTLRRILADTVFHFDLKAEKKKRKDKAELVS